MSTSQPLTQHPAFLRAQAVMARLAQLEAAGAKPCAWPRPAERGGGTVLVSEDPSKPGGWRATSFGADGAPTGHSEAPSFREALRTAHHLGANILGEPIPSQST